MSSKKLINIGRLLSNNNKKNITLNDYVNISQILKSIPNSNSINDVDLYKIIMNKLNKNAPIENIMNNYMLNSIYDNENNTSDEIIDTNEYRKNIIVKRKINYNNKIDYVFGQLDKALIPKNNYKRAYIVLDTDNIDTTLSNGVNTFGWNFLNNATVKVGTVNYIGKVRDIVGMRVYGAKINIDASPTTVFAQSGTNPTYVGSTLNPYYYNNNSTITSNALTILIHEFSAQASIGREGRKYHFILLPFNISLVAAPAEYYAEYINITKGDGWIWFKIPITTFSTLTISMGNPFSLITISKNIRTLITMEIIYLDNNDN